MFSLMQIANAYHILSVRTFKRHVRESGLDKQLPKLVKNKATIYQNELRIIQQYLGYSKKLNKMMETVEP